MGIRRQFFTHTLPVGAMVSALFPAVWPLLAISAILRAVSAWVVSDRILGARVPWLLLPIQDLLGFGLWIAGFFGNSIQWRGRRYLLKVTGRWSWQDNCRFATGEPSHRGVTRWSFWREGRCSPPARACPSSASRWPTDARSFGVSWRGWIGAWLRRWARRATARDYRLTD